MLSVELSALQVLRCFKKAENDLAYLDVNTHLFFKRVYVII